MVLPSACESVRDPAACPRNGGNIHVHSEIPFITIRPRIKRPNSQSISPTPLEIRDAVFQELIRISPASNYLEELVTGAGGLLSRGLLERHATNYGALPRTKHERTSLAWILNDYVRTHFPEYAKSHSGAGVVGVPGFWQELSGVVHIWKPRNYLVPLLVIPYKDSNGLIQACQIRLHANDILSDDKRYCWLSSPLERHGTSSGTPIHFTRLIVQRLNDSKEHQLSTETNILYWNGPKGIDDALRAGVALRSLTISEWHATLRNEPLEEVNKFCREIGFKPSHS